MDVIETKACSQCGEAKPHTEFSKNRAARDGLRPNCKGCERAYREANPGRQAERNRAYYEANKQSRAEYNRDWHVANREQVAERHREWKLSRKFGISGQHYEALLAHQGGRCAGCGTTECPSGRAFQVDHNHACCPYPEEGAGQLRACGKCVRGLLCVGCNLADALAGRPHVDWVAILEGRSVS